MEPRALLAYLYEYLATLGSFQNCPRLTKSHSIQCLSPRPQRRVPSQKLMRKCSAQTAQSTQTVVTVMLSPKSDYVQMHEMFHG